MGEKQPVAIVIPSVKSLPRNVFEGNLRFMISLLIVFFAKIFAVLWLYCLLSSLGHFRWIAWDSGWYVGIAEFGYSFHFPLAYAFFPGYPLVIYALWLVIRDMVAAAVLPSLVFGVAWIPFFQAVAEHYMPRPEAFGCTLLAAFFPIVFVSTTIPYSESLFLFTSVASWFFYLKKRTLSASLLAAVASITRIIGVFIVIPIFLDLLFHRKWKPLLYTFIPPLAFLGWMTYCFLSTGDWFIFWSVQERWYPMLGTLLKDVVPILLGAQIRLEFPDLFYLMWAILAGYLVFRSWDYDWRLATYASSVFILLLLFGIAVIRHVSFIFPMWLIRIKSRVAIAIACALSYIFSLILWQQFLTSYLHHIMV